MKQIFTFATLLLLCCCAYSQNAMFVSFEKGSEYRQLRSKLIGNPLVSVVDDVHDQELLLNVNEFNFKYDFNNGSLYKVTMMKSYKKARQATDAIDGCLRYFDIIKAQKVDDIALANTRCYVFISEGKVYKFLVTQQSKKKFSLELSSKYVQNTPLFAHDDYCTLVEWQSSLSSAK